MATAFVDESVRPRGAGLLLLAAVVVPEHDAECRRTMQRLRLAGQRRIHCGTRARPDGIGSSTA